MLKNHLKIALRHLWRSRLYACINVVGLSMGITSVLFALLYVLDEHNFDQFHTRNPHLYRVTTSFIKDGKRVLSGGTGQVQGPLFKAQVPEVSQFSRIMGGDIYGDIRNGKDALRLQILFVDKSFFDIFSFKLLSGNPASVLSTTNSVVITEKTARKFFNSIDVEGRVLQMDDDPSARKLQKPLVVTGVVENPPVNSSIQFDMLFPFAFMQVSFQDHSWLNSYLGTFVVLHPDANVHAVEAKFNHIARKHASFQVAEYVQSQGFDPKIRYALQPITDIHLNPQELNDQNREGGVINGSQPEYSYLFLGIAFFILLMASINFINISIADSLKRAKEIGIRKITGSTPMQIISGHIIEATLLFVPALCIGWALTFVGLSVLNSLSGKQISFDAFWRLEFLVCTLTVLVVNLLATGIYPAYLLARQNPVSMLQQTQKISGTGYIGKSLVIFQFVVAASLGIMSLIFYRQMRFIQDRNLGYDPKQVIEVRIPGLADTQNVVGYFKNELELDSRITHVSVTGNFGMRGTKINQRQFQSYYRSADERYLPLFQMELKAGENFPASLAGKSRSVLVNQAFVQSAGISAPIGRQLLVDSYFGDEPLNIIGVVSDFHSGSLREKIQPMVIVSSKAYGGDVVLLKLKGPVQPQTSERLKNTFKKYFPGSVFELKYVDARIASEYQHDLRWQKIIVYATGLSVLICCLGLFALGHLSASQRIREIAVRKVLGAGVADIALLFVGGFLKIVCVALLFALPLSYYTGNFWLEGFAYRTNISCWMLAVPGCLTILIVIVTVGWQVVTAALLNPIHAIRSD